MRPVFLFDRPTLLLSFCIQILGPLLLWLFYLPIAGHAQVPTPPVTTSITGNTVTGNVSTQIVLPQPGGNVYGIRGGQTAGTNLFHSFGQFNVGAGDIAQFQTSNLSPNAAINNILGRVNGQQSASQIFGTIDSATFYPSANLFLMNPYGFLFGAHATVNVGGMVAFTSADYLRLQEAGGDGIFYANSEANSVLTSAPVAAYGFLGSNPGAITVQGSQLTVTPGQSLSLVGGNITIQSGTLDDGTVQPARLSAQGGQINVASVASPGEILTGTLAQAPNINGQSFGNLGAIQISEQSVIDASGDGGGTVLIRGGQFLLDSSSISANVSGPGPVINGTESIGGGIDIQVNQDALIQNGVLIDTSVVGSATPGVQYGGIHVKAEHIEVAGIADFEAGIVVPSMIQSSVVPESTGGGSGNIELDANSILIQNIGVLETFTQGAGDAGNIIVKANQNIDMVLGIVDSVSLGGAGDAGKIEVTSVNGNISTGEFTRIITQATRGSTGNVGSITVKAPHGDIVLGGFTEISNETVEGVLGGVEIAANNLSLDGTTVIEGDNFSPLMPGNITVTLSDTLTLNGGSHIRTTAQGPAPAAADLTIRAQNVNITGESFLSTESSSSGDGGQLNVFTNSLQLTNGGQIRSPSERGVDPDLGTPIIPSGAGGTINIQGFASPAASVLIDGSGSGIFTNTAGTGAGGNIHILANSVTLQNRGTLSAATTGIASSATGGTITVNAGTVTLNSGGTMTAASTGPGASGDVVVQGLASPAQSILIDGAESGIFTDTSSTGTGGNTHLSANSVTLQNGGTLSSATTGIAPFATGGMITVNAEHVAVNTQGLITADTNGIAPAGVVDINTGTLALNNGGQIRSSSGAETEQISALAFSLVATPALTGGTITVQGQSGNGSQADSVTIDGAGSGIFTQSTGNRPGGDINVLTSQSAAMTNGASVSASSTGTGNAGNIDINAGNQLAMTNSTVTTEASQASGGSIKITTTPSGTVELTNSTVSASVLDGTGGGGSVDIDPQFVILQNSQILANAVFGPGGNINITTNLLLQDTASVISASSQFGQQGTIFIQSPISPASGKILPLGQKPLIPATLLSQRCAALAGGNASSFTVAGRDSLPAEPGGWVPTPLALAALSTGTGQEETAKGLSGLSSSSGFSGSKHQTNQTDQINQTNQPILSLRKIAPPGFLTQSFPVDWSDCTS